MDPLVLENLGIARAVAAEAATRDAHHVITADLGDLTSSSTSSSGRRRSPQSSWGNAKFEGRVIPDRVRGAGATTERSIAWKIENGMGASVETGA